MKNTSSLEARSIEAAAFYVLKTAARRASGFSLRGFRSASSDHKCKPGELAREEERMSKVTGETRDNELKDGVGSSRLWRLGK